MGINLRAFPEKCFEQIVIKNFKLNKFWSILRRKLKEIPLAAPNLILRVGIRNLVSPVGFEPTTP